MFVTIILENIDTENMPVCIDRFKSKDDDISKK